MIDSDKLPDRIATIGFGEAARAFASGWRETHTGRITSFDVKINDPAARPELYSHAGEADVEIMLTVREAIDAAPFIFSLVTVDQAVLAARSAASWLAPGSIWFDCNSSSPESKLEAAAVIESSGGRYVDVAIMAPVYRKKHRTPLLVSGPHSEEAKTILTLLGMHADCAGPKTGQASAVKMIRSVMIKGLEALTVECIVAARSAGVETLVLESLQASDPGIDWKARSSYNLERMIAHGTRRAAEMREVAATIAFLGLPARMSNATAEWQDQIAGLRLECGEDDLEERADRILGAFRTLQP